MDGSLIAGLPDRHYDLIVDDSLLATREATLRPGRCFPGSDLTLEDSTRVAQSGGA